MKRKPSRTRDIAACEESGSECLEEPLSTNVSPFECFDNSLWLVLYHGTTDSSLRCQLLLCLLALLKADERRRSSQQESSKSLFDFIRTGKESLISELSTLLRTADGSPQTMQIALSTLLKLRQILGNETPFSISSLFTEALCARLQALKDILETPAPSCPSLRPSLTRTLMFLRSCSSLLFDPIPDGGQPLRSARIFLRVELDWRALITNTLLLREDSEVLNSSIIEDREGMGVYRIPKENCPEREMIFGGAIFSQFYVYKK